MNQLFGGDLLGFAFHMFTALSVIFGFCLGASSHILGVACMLMFVCGWRCSKKGKIIYLRSFERSIYSDWRSQV